MPWNGEKLRKRGLKLVAFFLLSFFISNWLLMYIIGSDAWFPLVTDDPRNHLKGLVCILLFTAGFFMLFARFREQACTFICPYGRFQSVMLDSDSLVVAYDHVRGEGRGKAGKGKRSPEERPPPGSATVSIARPALPSAQPASISAMAFRWNASTAPTASTPATASWKR